MIAGIANGLYSRVNVLSKIPIIGAKTGVHISHYRLKKRRILVALAAGLICTATTFNAPLAAKPFPHVKARIDLTLNKGLDRLTGRVVLEIKNTTSRRLMHLDLWLFPERLRSPSKLMSEVDKGHLFPRSFSPGRLHIKKALNDSGKSLSIQKISPTLARVKLAKAHEPGTEIRVAVDFETVVPHRFGPFGVANNQLVVDGGFFPRPPPLTDTGYDAEAPPDVIDYAVKVISPTDKPQAAIVNGRMTLLPHRGIIGTGQANRVSLVVFTKFQVTALKEGNTHVVFVHRRVRPQRRGPDGLSDFGATDFAGQVVATVASFLKFYQRLNKVPPLPQRVLLVEAGLRRDMAIPSVAMTLVSDRAFEITGLERLRKLHRLALLRACIASLVGSQVTRNQPRKWVQRVQDIIASDLVLRWENAQYGRRESMRQVLAAGAFVSYVDDVLYAPQLPMEQVYFRPVDDTDRFRDRFNLFSHRYPSGHRLFVKLTDLMGEKRVSRLVNTLLRGQAFPDALKRLAPEANSVFLKQWDGPYPKINYRLDKVRNGRDAKGWFADLSVRKEGRVNIIEPVSIAIWDKAGGKFIRRWDGVGHQQRFRVRLKAPMKRIIVDPKYRLLESSLRAGLHPRADNDSHRRWKFLVDGVFFGLTSSGYLSGGVVTTLKQHYLSDHSFVFEPFESGLSTGLGITWYHHFGALVRPNVRKAYGGLKLRAEWYRETERWTSGMMAQASAQVGFNNTLSRVNPQKGIKAGLSLGVSIFAGTERTTWAGFASGHLAGILNLGREHTLASRLAWSSVIGDILPPQQLRLGGRHLVRAFDLLAATGKHRALLSVEWRHLWTRDLSINVAHLAWVYSLQGVLFADAALLSDNITTMFASESLFAGIGYGLRFFYRVFGIHPMVLALDLSVPIVQGRRNPSAPTLPLSVIVGVGQTF